jgi:hypothetical protein
VNARKGGFDFRAFLLNGSNCVCLIRVFSTIPFSVVQSAEHSAPALTMTQASIILLQHDGTLPLTGNTRFSAFGASADDINIPWGNSDGFNVQGTKTIPGLTVMPECCDYVSTRTSPVFRRLHRLDRELLDAGRPELPRSRTGGRPSRAHSADSLAEAIALLADPLAVAARALPHLLKRFLPASVGAINRTHSVRASQLSQKLSSRRRQGSSAITRFARYACADVRTRMST